MSSNRIKGVRRHVGPNWNEGQNLSEDMPKPVELGDDDFGAMHTVCCVIHHRIDLLTQTLDPADVLRVAIVVDKYDLSVAMKFALAPWLKLRDDMNMMQLGYMMAATHRLRDEERFVETTLALILRCDASYWCLSEHEMISEVLCAKTSGKVACQLCDSWPSRISARHRFGCWGLYAE
ncbi:hypothetical protein Micbo1qcDRAFT_181424 [Microdochium bolleyi]|uniref:BTB domain-containing protein n=1 Tax=Microdochium bolleyi TaxID=196109 RepID=A0A136IIN2_9PEZI|nr:hypothetical protein Micbo1qcDRAFT_181424 [Microdochium bolleyi]